jgi:hypothetical protein
VYTCISKNNQLNKFARKTEKNCDTKELHGLIIVLNRSSLAVLVSIRGKSRQPWSFFDHEMNIKYRYRDKIERKTEKNCDTKELHGLIVVLNRSSLTVLVSIRGKSRQPWSFCTIK